MSEAKNTKKILQALVLTLMLIGLPLGSWFYLKKGFDYQKNLMDELKNYGKMPDFKLLTQNGDSLSRDELKGKVIVADFYVKDSQSAEKTMDYLRKFSEQFHDQEGLVFLSHQLSPLGASASGLKEQSQQESLDNDLNYFLSGSKKEMLSILSIGYKVPVLKQKQDNGMIPLKSNINQLPREYPYFVLVDTSLAIRNYYDINDAASVEKLVQHLAISIPREKKEKPVLVIDEEK